jgi:hypothetical protein
VAPGSIPEIFIFLLVGILIARNFDGHSKRHDYLRRKAWHQSKRQLLHHSINSPCKASCYWLLPGLEKRAQSNEDNEKLYTFTDIKCKESQLDWY